MAKTWFVNRVEYRSYTFYYLSDEPSVEKRRRDITRYFVSESGATLELFENQGRVVDEGTLSFSDDNGGEVLQRLVERIQDKPPLTLRLIPSGN